MRTITELTELNTALLAAGVIAFSSAWLLLWLVFTGINKSLQGYGTGDLSIVGRSPVPTEAAPRKKR